MSEYDDLRIRLEPGDSDVYRVRAERLDGSVATGEFANPLGDVELENFILRVGMPRRHVRRWSSNQVEEARRVGGRLFGALMRDDVAVTYANARGRAEARRRGLRITLTLTDAPALMRLPWEYLHDGTGFLAQSRETPLVRGLEIPTVRPVQPLSLPLRVLGLVSAPRDEEPLDANAERAKLEAALEPLISESVVDLRWVDGGTLSALELTLGRLGPVHVLHFIGHGGYDDRFGGGALAIEAEDRSTRPVTGEDLCVLLGDQGSLRLVVLNSCEGARTSVSDPFSGVATALVQCRIPAVVAMQFEITDGAAITFSARLYQSLAGGNPIDEAIVDTRKAMFAAEHQAEFGTPVLFAVPSRTKLFDVAVPVAAEPVPDAEPRETEREDTELILKPRLVLELPDALTAGASLVARIEVEAQESQGRRRRSTEVTALVTTSEHLTVEGPDTYPLRLGPDAAEVVRVPVRVATTATAHDPLLVALLLVHEGRPAAFTQRRLMLEQPHEEPAPSRAVVVDSRAVAPDLTIQVLGTGDQRSCSITSPLVDELAVPTVERWTLPAPIRPLVTRLLRDVSAYDVSAYERRAALVGAGLQLFRATPPLFQRALWELVEAGIPVRSVFIVTDEPEFPWELVIPFRESERRAALGVEFAVGRWHRRDQQAPPQRLPLADPLVIAPRYEATLSLLRTEEEAQLVVATMGGRRLAPATLQSLDEALRHAPAGLIHFAGQANRQEGSATLYLEGGERLTDIQLAGLAGVAEGIRRGRPLVFLNASAIGLVPSFLDLGASAVIAPAWDISDEVAAAFAREFYAALTADPQRPFADILRAIRRRAYENDEPDDSWAAYMFFGDPVAARSA
jgi:CHAT domain-containing protein